jgi:hypothetical protein
MFTRQLSTRPLALTSIFIRRSENRIGLFKRPAAESLYNLSHTYAGEVVALSWDYVCRTSDYAAERPYARADISKYTHTDTHTDIRTCDWLFNDALLTVGIIIASNILERYL